MGRSEGSGPLNPCRQIALNCLTLGCLLAIISTPLSAQQSSPDPNAAKHLKPITFAEFRDSVLNGTQINSRIIPPSHILRALSQAPQWQKNPKNKAWIRLKSCRVTCQPIMRMGKPSQPIMQFRPETQQHLTKRYPARTEAIYLDLPVDFMDVEVGLEVNLENVVIRAPLTFDNVDFERDLSFQGAVFERAATFHKVRFKGRSDFSGVYVRENLSIQECQFSRQAAFAKSVTGQQGKVYLSGDKLDVPLDFSESTLLGKLTLEGVTQTFQFDGKVYLNGINLDVKGPSGELRIKNAEFRDEVYLDRDKWQKLNFAESEGGLHRPIRFTGSYDFRQTVLAVADFGGVEFEGFGDFTGAKITNLVNFERTKFRKQTQLSWVQIDGKLGKPESGLTSRSNFSALDMQTYEELERNFDALGDLESSNECRFQKRLLSEGRGPEWAFLGYETHPLNPFVSGCLILMLFCIINAVLFRNGTFSDGVWNWPPRPVRLTLRTAALRRDFPANYTATALGRIVFGTEFWIMRLMWIFYAVAWMHKSKLLKELIPYLWPK